MHFSWVLIACFIFLELHQNEVDAHWFRNIKRKIRIRPKVPFVRGSLCRMRHHRTIVDENNRYVKCVRSCPSTGYQELYSVRWGHYCKPVVIPKGCSDQYCNTCIASYKWIFDATRYRSKCVRKCPSGYRERMPRCEKCLVNNCQRCENDLWRCSKCKWGLALQRTYMGSTLCLRRCSRGFEKKNVDGVVRCSRPIVPTPPLPTTDITTDMSTTEETSTTDVPTQQPDTTNIITSSETPTTQTTTTTTATTTTTTPQPTTTTPQPTTTTTAKPPPKGCEDTFCTMCSEGYRKLVLPFGNSTCVERCPVGFAAQGVVCLACSDARCGSCEASISECERCRPGFSLMLDAKNISTECVRYCPKGYTTETINGAQVCTKEEERECPVANCDQCIGDSLVPLNRGCLKCKKGFTLFRGSLSDHCYTVCPPGHNEITEPKTKSAICEKCKIPFCKICNRADICDACIEPMVLDTSTNRCRFCREYTTYSYATRKCVPVDTNQPESNLDNNEIVFGGPLVG
ncbi:proprotein convertase subtilisin/kexin type 5-like isoform X2 [Clytia hemisphaerica]|uniref:EGF-like domain-containing protein n=1 Tax=Clytia hemisphaerica TaxID=252671 RepID=A0A7M5U2E4_9CNID